MTRAEVDTTACDVEAIHIPGAIQPRGVLLALAAGPLTVLQVSANCEALLRITPAKAAGAHLAALVGAAPALVAAAAAADSTVGEPMTVELGGRRLDVLVHRHHDVTVVELEPHDPAAAGTDAALRHALARLQRPNTVAQLGAIVVDAIRRITGFDRVMLYRFDVDGHGNVVEEALGEGVDSYRGRWFPASYIPRQAREMYVLNWLRLIPDATYTPVPLVPGVRPDTGAPLDLSFASLRSVSPIHLDYHRNMGVGASKSVSLVEDQRLWGLIACHHNTRRHVTFTARAACEAIGRIVSLQIAALQELEVRTVRATLRDTEARLVDAMRASRTGIVAALAPRGDALRELAGASGTAIATATDIRTSGATPSIPELVELVGWLRKSGATGILHTDRLASLHPPAVKYTHVASGLVALALPGTPLSYVLWFRPEAVRTVTWAGNPEKSVEIVAGTTQLHPRHSFAAWTEIVRGRSQAWRTAELDAVEELRRRALEVDLATQIATAEQAVRLRDEMVAIVSHDLKGPLHVVELSTEVLRPLCGADPAALTTLARIERAVGAMNRLVHDLLDLAKIESGRFDVLQVACAASQLVADASPVLGTLAEGKQVRLEWAIEGDPWVAADPERVHQVIANIVGNAIKFTPTAGVVRVAIKRLDALVQFAVRDTGPGLAPAELAHVFDRDWQGRRGSTAGSGLGLYIAKGIGEAHGQTVWAESTYGAGATFYFTLPAHGA